MRKVIEYFSDKEFDVMGVGSFGPIDPVKVQKLMVILQKHQNLIGVISI